MPAPASRLKALGAAKPDMKLSINDAYTLCVQAVVAIGAGFKAASGLFADAGATMPTSRNSCVWSEIRASGSRNCVGGHLQQRQLHTAVVIGLLWAVKVRRRLNELSAMQRRR